MEKSFIIVLEQEGEGFLFWGTYEEARAEYPEAYSITPERV